MRIRPEIEADRAAVRAVNEAAFETSVEADIVDVLRRKGVQLVSLVAAVDDAVVGHILFSPVSLAEPPHLRIMGLGPMAVAPEHLSAARNSFKRDYHAETPEGFQMPMVTVFHRKGDEIRHFWSSEMLYAPTDPGQDPRHSGTLEPLWNLFDLTPAGRPSDWQEQLNYD